MSPDIKKGETGPSVVFILPIGLTLGGSNTWSIQLAGRLARAGRAVTLVEHTCVDWHPRLDIPIPAGVRLVRCPGPTPFEARPEDVEGFAAVYRELLPALFVPNHSAAAYAACAKLATERPADIRVLGVGHGNSAGYYDLLKYYEPAIVTFLATNKVMECDLKAMMPDRVGDVVSRPCAVDVQEHLTRRYSVAHEPLRLAYAGRVTNHEKRVADLVVLARELHARGVDFMMRIIGEGGYKPTLVRDIEALDPDLRRRISIEAMMLPHDLRRVWRATDVCLLVSDTESGGLSMLEAMAEGCVPVSTRTEGPSEIINHRSNGFLGDVGDMDSMACHILDLHTNRSVLSSVGARAHETVRTMFSLDPYVPWFLELVDDAWRKPTRTWPADRALYLRTMERTQGGGRWKKLIKLFCGC